MTTGDAGVLTLAAAVADGADVDWDHAESSAAGPDEQHVVRQLRLLATVATTARAQARTWGPLHLRGIIGRGASGTVHRAWDPRLDLEVALKLLHVPVATEGRVLAQIRHPNVVTVYGADVFDGMAGVWMEFVTGRTLKEIVTEHGPFGAHEAALIGRDVCRALAAVHQRGFVHRDVKAQNVMREAGGRTLLMDFGAGNRIDNAAPAGPLAGTPAYLAPEVLAGAPATPQSDLYSVGVLLYFLVSGTFPVVAASIDALRERHAQGGRTRLRDVRPDIPAAFARAVESATAPDPSQRPATAGELEALLDRVLDGDVVPTEESPVRPSNHKTRRLVVSAIAATALVAILAVALIGWTGWPRPSPPLRRNSVAVLPFENLTHGAVQDDYLTEGLTADLSAHLTELKDLHVIAGTSTQRLRDKHYSDRDLGSELGVATVLDGTVQQDGDRVRIVSRLVDVATGEQLWSASFERNVKDMFALQTDVARRIAVALKGELTRPDIEALDSGETGDFEAAKLYAKGRYYAELRTEDGLNRSIELFSAALVRDPKYAAASAGLADAYTALGTYGFLPRSEAFARAASEARRALGLDPTLPQAHAALGYALKNQFQWTDAESHLTKAIELKPSWATGHHWYSILLTQHGQFARAITEAKAAISLDPLALGPNLQLAAALLMGRRYDDAVKQYERALEIEPDVASAYRSIALARAYQGQFAAAQTAIDRAIQVTPAGAEDQETSGALGYLYGRSGRLSEASRIARGLRERYTAANEEVTANLAGIYAGLGDRDETIRWLRIAVEQRDPEVGYLKVDPRWDVVRGDPEFATFLQKLGFY